MTIFLICASSGISQSNYNYAIPGPYEDYPGPYYVRVFVNFLQKPNDQWTNNWNLQAEANAVFTTLNAAYNKHRIYFVPYQSLCDGGNYQLHTTNDNALQIRAQQSSTLLDAAIHIYVIHDSENDFSGWEFNTPNNYFQINGKRNGILVTRSEIVVHEMGHMLGLVHTFTGSSSGGCDETPGSCGTEEPCYCCGDYVCDTDINPSQLINTGANCTHATIPEHIVKNFMSYTVPGDCKNQFSLEQAKRMRTYLELAPVLQSAQIKPTNYPGSTIDPVSANIVVNSGELVINSTLEMLPGSKITVKKGAKLRVAATITGACGQMWQGIVVEGSTFTSQTPTNQGQVAVWAAGLIEHAKVAIDVQSTGDDGEPANNTGGGIVQIVGGQFINNTIGVRFGPYASPGNGVANTSFIFSPQFSVTDDYRGGEAQPTFMDLDGVVRLKIQFGQFSELRTGCTGANSRANGINSKNAGFITTSGEFNNLNVGIRADQLTEGSGSFTITGSTFTNCYRGLVSTSTSGFHLANNDFLVDRPEKCPETNGTIIGAQIRGNTTGFLFSDNEFIHTNDFPAETLIGTDCQNLMEGLNNTILDNQYTNLTFGNRAIGNNNGFNDGLLYLCNRNYNVFGEPSDFKIESGSIRSVQSDKSSLGAILPTGNIFSDAGFTFENLGSPVKYFFYGADNFQTPTVGSGFVGINPEEVIISNTNCDEPLPCANCPKEIIEDWKDEFFQKKSDWSEKNTELPSITDTTEIKEQLAEIHNLRLDMNRTGGLLLKSFGQDTSQIEVDSITTWLSRIQTNQTDIRLARHYFFTGNFVKFDTLWQQMEATFTFDAPSEQIYDRLDDIFTLLRTHLEGGGQLKSLSENTISDLKEIALTCDEAGYLASVILWRNGIWFEPECEPAVEESKPILMSNEVKSESLILSPNPCDESLTIECAHISSLNCKFFLFDILGQIVLEADLSNLPDKKIVDTKHIMSGIYFAKISGIDTAGQSHKIIVAH